jgi:Fe-only nitrogenase accessory protein AnfO
MIPEIAVMLGSDGTTITLTGPGEVVIFSRAIDAWEPAKRLPFSLDTGAGLAGTRKKMAELVSFLGDCRTFVARAASGAIFFELEKAGCSVWEIDGFPADFLESVWKDEEMQQEVIPSGVSDIPVPVEVAPGQYYLSIKDYQGKRPEVSSKQILQKFIRAGKYQTLEVICDHVPPWIALEASCCGFTMESNRLGPGEVKLVLTRHDPCTC